MDVTVSHSKDSGTLEDGFTFTPALYLDGDHRPGGNVELTYLLDPNDSILAIVGLNVVDFPTPPFDGSLCIAPFRVLFLYPQWPFDNISLDLDIPNDPALSGLTVLLQGLIGPSFANPKDAAWTNCGAVEIE